MNIKNVFCTLFLKAFSLSNIVAQPKVIAHRGYWDDYTPQNSIASLKKAQEADIYGSEFDVHLTSDGVLILFHSNNINGMKIEETPYTKFKDLRIMDAQYGKLSKLSKNEEKIPTLEEFLKQGKKNKKTKLILELKPHSSKELEDKAVAAVVEMVEKVGVTNQIEYISFSLNICKEFVRLSPKTPVAYLKGDLSPQEVKAHNIPGIDYSLSVLKKNKHWITDAHNLKMFVNVWTVNDKADMQEMIDAGVDFITTDKPTLCKELINANKTNKKKK